MSDAELTNALQQANAAARHGNLRAAQHWTKVATAMAAAASTARPATPPDDNEQERRAELRRRFARMVDATHDVRQWEQERDHYYAQVATACENGTEPPPPLRPHPCGPLAADEYLRRIAQGEED